MRYTFDKPIVKGGRTYAPVFGAGIDADGALDFGRAVVVRAYYPDNPRAPAIPRYGIRVPVNPLPKSAARADPFIPERSDRPAPMTAEERAMAEWYDGILRSDRQRRSAASIARRALRPGRLPANLTTCEGGGAALVRRVARTLAHMGLRKQALWAICRALARLQGK